MNEKPVVWASIDIARALRMLLVNHEQRIQPGAGHDFDESAASLINALRLLVELIDGTAATYESHPGKKPG